MVGLQCLGLILDCIFKAFVLNHPLFQALLSNVNLGGKFTTTTGIITIACHCLDVHSETCTLLETYPHWVKFLTTKDCITFVVHCLPLTSIVSLVVVFHINPLCCWWLIWPIQNEAKKLKNNWNPGIWVLI